MECEWTHFLMKSNSVRGAGNFPALEVSITRPQPHLLSLPLGPSGRVRQWVSGVVVKRDLKNGTPLIPVLDEAIPAAGGNLGRLHGVPCRTDAHTVVRLDSAHDLCSGVSSETKEALAMLRYSKSVHAEGRAWSQQKGNVVTEAALVSYSPILTALGKEVRVPNTAKDEHIAPGCTSRRLPGRMNRVN
eukprot:1158741-Pelagomonas_calceolata.AAC.10